MVETPIGANGIMIGGETGTGQKNYTRLLNKNGGWLMAAKKDGLINW